MGVLLFQLLVEGRDVQDEENWGEGGALGNPCSYRRWRSRPAVEMKGGLSPSQPVFCPEYQPPWKAHFSEGG
jgi:hypothetical protein